MLASPPTSLTTSVTIIDCYLLVFNWGGCHHKGLNNMLIEYWISKYYLSCFSFVEKAPRDHRNVELRSLKNRYSCEAFGCASLVPAVDRAALVSTLGIQTEPQQALLPNSADSRRHGPPYLIFSPSRKNRLDSALNFYYHNNV